MAEKSGLFNYTESNPRRYKDLDFADMMSLFVGRSGYLPNYLSELKVVPTEVDRQVRISPGGAWLGDPPGWWYINDSYEPEITFNLTQPSSGNFRVDRVILSLDRGTDALCISAGVLQGSENDPYPPAINLSGTLDIPLAYVKVYGDTSTVEITDERVPCVRSSSGMDERSESWTLTFSDINKFIKCVNDTSDITVTVPLNSNVALPVNTEIVICQFDETYTVEIQAQSGVQVRSLENALTSDGQYSAFTLRKIGEDEWIAVGALTS